MKNKFALEKELGLLREKLQSPWRVISAYMPKETLRELSIIDDKFTEWHTSHVEQHKECVELILALSGEAAFGFCGQVNHLHPGDCVIQTSRESHDSGRSLNGRFLYCCIHLYPGYIYWEIFDLDGTEYKSLCLERMSWELYRGIRDEVESVAEMPLPREQRHFYLECLMNCIRMKLLSTMPSIFSSAPPPIHHYRILAVMREIDESCGTVANAETLARKVGVSKSHFLRLFEATAKMQFREYVNKSRRMNFIKMRNEGCSLKEIANRIGFSSPAALLHWRKRQTNL